MRTKPISHIGSGIVLEIQKPRTCALATLLLAAACFGCPINVEAAGYKLADKTGASIAEFRDEVLNIKKQVDATMTALDKVVATAANDPRNAFKDFDKGVPRI